MTPRRICFVGDSLTAGTGDEMALGWPGRVCRALGPEVTLYNLGVRGETSADIRGRWRVECAPRLPGELDGRLVFCFGVNDMVADADGALRVAMEPSVENARAIIGEAMAWKPTLWIGPPPAPDMDPTFDDDRKATYDPHTTRVATLNTLYKDAAHDMGVAYLDVFRALSGDTRWVAAQSAGDGVHPPASGYDLLAEHVAAWPAWQDWFHD